MMKQETKQGTAKFFVMIFIICIIAGCAGENDAQQLVEEEKVQEELKIEDEQVLKELEDNKVEEERLAKESEEKRLEEERLTKEAEEERLEAERLKQIEEQKALEAAQKAIIPIAAPVTTPKTSATTRSGGCPTCGNIGSCKEAKNLLASGCYKLDRDDDGVPCESLCK